MKTGSFIAKQDLSFLVMIAKRILLLMVLYQLCRLFFFGFNISYFHFQESRSVLEIFLGSLRFDLAAILYLNVVYIGMFILPLNVRFNRAYRSAGKFIFIFVN